MPKENEGYQSNMTPEQAENLKAVKDVEALVVKKFTEIGDSFEKMEGQLKETGSVSVEMKSQMLKLKEDYDGVFDRLQQLEQKGVSIREDAIAFNIGEEFIKSDQFKAMQDGTVGRARLNVKTAIINATGQDQPLVPADRVQGIHTVPNRELMIRDIMPSTPTSSNLIEFVRESTFTNNAGPQVGGSPEAFENVTKPESGITFTLATQAVQTLAHWIPASKQVIEDSAQLQSFISGRLMYGLKLYEENQLLAGNNTNGQLNGIITQATAYTVQSPQLTNQLDIIREMIKQAHVGNYRPDYILLNPQEWFEIDTKKVGASDDRYVVGNPREMGVPRLWGLPVVVSNGVTAGQAVVGNFAMGCEIFDRNMASVEVSRENSDNFVKNMVTVLAEERVALVVYRTEAFIKATI